MFLVTHVTHTLSCTHFLVNLRIVMVLMVVVLVIWVKTLPLLPPTNLSNARAVARIVRHVDLLGPVIVPPQSRLIINEANHLPAELRLLLQRRNPLRRLHHLQFLVVDPIPNMVVKAYVTMKMKCGMPSGGCVDLPIPFGI